MPNANQDSLERFVLAQERDYPIAYAELREGLKRSHWMWYIFPQLRGLGYSPMSHYYGIISLDEAEAYLAHELLGARLRDIGRLLIELPTNDPKLIFGDIDAQKLHSSLTLFDALGTEPLFADLLSKFFSGRKDRTTLDKIKKNAI